jgi:AAA+ superfamily predicted ATPase
MSPTLSAILTHLSELAHWRIAPYFAEKELKRGKIPKPKTVDDDSPLALFLQQHPLTTDEYAVVALSLLPHVQPHFFDSLMREYMPQGGDFPQIGGARGANFRGFLPTGETALFLLAGDDMERRLELQQIFASDHFFSIKKILWLEEVAAGEPAMCGRIVLSPEYVELFTTGKLQRPRFSTSFPAERVETSLDWDDLVLNAQTRAQVQELLTWLRHGNTLFHDYGLGKRIKPGYRVLFWGPPGTGKTLTAGLLGKHSGRDVYKIDLSMVVSKFIGETEKNLSNLFDRAENKDWILFFDEADALFGKRTSVRDAHDKYANQEVSYLLQRVETYNGLVILASNFKSNIDDAFMRRFQSVIHFPMPKTNERYLLWEMAFPNKIQVNTLNINSLAQKYELSGASILNVVQYACLQALERGDDHILETDVREGINREFIKEGKTAY